MEERTATAPPSEGVSPADGTVELGPANPPTPEELMEELKAAKEVVERQRQSLDDRDEEIKRLERKHTAVKRIFGDLWDQKIVRRRRCIKELKVVRGSEEELLETVGTWKGTFIQTSKQIASKLEEIQKLTKKVEEHQQGKLEKPLMGLKEGEMSMASLTGTLAGRKDAAELFPEEVWIMIIGNISDPKDLWNLCNTCQLFDKILSKWKTGWLLSQALPYLYKDLPGAKLLECRTICKSWKEAVDNFLENHPSLIPPDGDSADPRRLDFVNPMREKKLGERYEIRFSSSTDVNLFRNRRYTAKWTQNQIIGRSIILRLGRRYEHTLTEAEERDMEAVERNKIADPEFSQVWSRFYRFLGSFGKEVHSLAIYFTSNHGDGEAWEGKLLQFLTSDVFQFFPNLRKLNLDDPNWLFNSVTFEALSLTPKLEMLGSECWGGRLALTILRRYHLQLTKLHLTPGTWLGVSRLDWPNLKELHLELTQNDDVDFQCLYGVHMPQLTKLGLHLGNLELEHDKDAPSFDSIINLIQELSSTTSLNTLRIEGGVKSLYVGEVQGDPYGTSKVKTLEFEHCSFYYEGVPEYDFLLACFPLLENLNLFVKAEHKDYPREPPLPQTEMSLEPRNQYDWMDDDEDDEFKSESEEGEEEEEHQDQEMVVVNKYIKKGAMYKSNIWELMPLLKVFTFQWDVYTRHEYEAYSKKLKHQN